MNNGKNGIGLGLRTCHLFGGKKKVRRKKRLLSTPKISFCSFCDNVSFVIVVDIKIFQSSRANSAIFTVQGSTFFQTTLFADCSRCILPKHNLNNDKVLFKCSETKFSITNPLY